MSMRATESQPSSLSPGFINIQHSIFRNSNEDDQDNWDLVPAFYFRLISYVTFLGITFLVVCLIVKLLKEDCDESSRVQVGDADESTRLLSKETINSITYGTCTLEEDVEAQGCTSSYSSSEDLYDEKICVICYDEERNCFFVPCGHCATCNTCAQRIISGENRDCVICRRLIRKVRKLITS